MYYSYQVCYGLFDRIVHALDPQAYQSALPQRWLMTLVSIYGLGFQLLLLGLALIWLPPHGFYPESWRLMYFCLCLLSYAKGLNRFPVKSKCLV